MTRTKDDYSYLSQLEVTRMSTRRQPESSLWSMELPTPVPLVPYTPKGAKAGHFLDIHSALQHQRTMMITKRIEGEYANTIIASLIHWFSESQKDDITLYFNTPTPTATDDVAAASSSSLPMTLAIYDLLQQVHNDPKMTLKIHTCNLGLCHGMNALLCGAGSIGYRTAMTNARFIIQKCGIESQQQGGGGGGESKEPNIKQQQLQQQASEVESQVQSIQSWNERMEHELSRMTRQPWTRIHQDIQRRFYLSSEEAVHYGLIDRVLLPTPRDKSWRGKEPTLGTFEGVDIQKYQKSKGKDGKKA